MDEDFNLFGELPKKEDFLPDFVKNFNKEKFFLELLGMGIHDPSEQMRLYAVAERCALSTGTKEAFIGAGIGFATGQPYIALGGMLAGMWHGTRSCVTAHEIQQVRIAAGQNVIQ